MFHLTKVLCQTALFCFREVHSWFETDLGGLPHHLGHLGAQLVPTGAEGAETGLRELSAGLAARLQELVELQDLLLDGVEVSQPVPALRLPLALQLRLPKALQLCLPQTQVYDLTDEGNDVQAVLQRLTD